MNIELLKHPLNWLIVWMMLLVAALGGKYAAQFFGMISTPAAPGGQLSSVANAGSLNPGWQGVTR